VTAAIAADVVAVRVCPSVHPSVRLIDGVVTIRVLYREKRLIGEAREEATSHLPPFEFATDRYQWNLPNRYHLTNFP